MLKLAISLNLFLTSCLCAINSSEIQPLHMEEVKSFLSKHLPMREDGKINIPLNIKHIKLDIGLSWCAPMSQVWLTKDDDLLVFGFEPNPDAITLIKEGKRIPDWWANNYLDPSHAIRLESDLPKLLGSRFIIIPCALGLSETPEATFYITSNDCGCSSLYRPVSMQVEKILTVPLLRLSSFFDVFPFDTHPLIDYIKIDAQGADLTIAKSAEHYMSDRVVCVTLEPEQSQYEGTTNSFEDIDMYMKSIGFIKYSSKNTKDPTYVNNKFMTYFMENNELNIFQEG